MQPSPRMDPRDAWDDEPTGRINVETTARVLVVEDDPELRAMISNRLRHDGCEVVEACSGQDALERLDESDTYERPLDLVVMDVRMPGISGLEVTYLIRSWRWRTPIVLVTAYPEPELFEEAARLDAQLLAKPFAFAKLSQAAMTAVRGRAS